MTSPSPLLYDTYYHIYNRGVNRENIFVEERNYELFLRLYTKHVSPVADLLSYCLLKNHFHLLLRVRSEEEILETKKAPRVSEESPSSSPLGSRYVSDQFSNFFNAYAKTMNKAYGRTGSLFQHPFGRVAITNSRQFWNVVAYIRQNPQKHGFVTDFRDWKYSSYGVILTNQHTAVKREDVMKWFGTTDDYFRLHSEWVTEAQIKWFAENDYESNY